MLTISIVFNNFILKMKKKNAIEIRKYVFIENVLRLLYN